MLYYNTKQYFISRSVSKIGTNIIRYELFSAKYRFFLGLRRKSPTILSLGRQLLARRRKFFRYVNKKTEFVIYSRRSGFSYFLHRRILRIHCGHKFFRCVLKSRLITPRLCLGYFVKTKVGGFVIHRFNKIYKKMMKKKRILAAKAVRKKIVRKQKKQQKKKSIKRSKRND